MYKNNMKDIASLDEKITQVKDKNTWKNSMINRAQELNRIYQENNSIIDEIKSFDLENYDDPEGLFTEIRNMYYDDFDKPEPHTH